MHRIEKCLLIGLLAVCGCGGAKTVAIRSVEPASTEVANIRSLAVLDLAYKPNPPVGVNITNSIVAELDQCGVFEIMERSAVAKVINEKDFNELISGDAAKISSVGKLLGVDGVVVGEVVAYDAGSAALSKKGTVGANLRLVDVKTARIIVSENPVANYDQFLGGEKAEAILAQLSQEVAKAFVARIAPHYVNRQKYLIEAGGDEGKLNEIGIKLASNGLWDKAQEQFEAAMKVNSSSAGIHNNLGVCFEQAGKLKQAVDEYETAMKINPQDERIMKNLASIRGTFAGPKLSAKETLDQYKKDSKTSTRPAAATSLPSAATMPTAK